MFSYVAHVFSKWLIIIIIGFIYTVVLSLSFRVNCGFNIYIAFVISMIIFCTLFLLLVPLPLPHVTVQYLCMCVRTVAFLRSLCHWPCMSIRWTDWNSTADTMFRNKWSLLFSSLISIIFFMVLFFIQFYIFYVCFRLLCVTVCLFFWCFADRASQYIYLSI